MEDGLTASDEVLDFIEVECGADRQFFAARKHHWRYLAKAMWLIDRKRQGLPIRSEDGAFLPISETDRNRYKAELCKT